MCLILAAVLRVEPGRMILLLSYFSFSVLVLPNSILAKSCVTLLSICLKRLARHYHRGLLTSGPLVTTTSMDTLPVVGAWDPPGPGRRPRAARFNAQR